MRGADDDDDGAAALRLLREDELVPTLGMPRGGVGPLGASAPPGAENVVVVDAAAARHARVLLGAGRVGRVCCVTPGALARATRTSVVADVSVRREAG